jgi:hypothetical protein
VSQVITFTPSGPTVRSWMESEAFVKFLMGPFGSGKTAGGVVEILRRSQLQAPGPDGKRRTRWAIIRNTFSDLKSTTIKSWEQWCPSGFGKFTVGTSPIVHHIKTEDLDMEVLFVPLDREDDVRKLLSLELTGALVDECREIPKAIFDALTGRVGRYPSRLQGGCTWSGIMGITNPPDTEHWLYKIAQDLPEGWAFFKQPSGRSPEAENIQNLPQGYYTRMMAGKDPEWIKVYIDGEFGFLIEGKPVYPGFRDSVHVAPQRIAPLPSIGLTLHADWGLTPAAVILQQWPDGRILGVDEFVCDDSGIVRFANSLSAYMRTTYPDHDVVAATGDPAGTTRGPDEDTIFEIMNRHTPWRWKPAPTNDITLRIEAVSILLNRMVDGKPGFILNPGCGRLRKGFNGGYHFDRGKTGNGTQFHEVPAKNMFSHPHDALQYGALYHGGADLVMNRERRKPGHGPLIADGVDGPVFGSDPVPQPAVSWNGQRPEPVKMPRYSSDYPLFS